jgi:hypothetical protein
VKLEILAGIYRQRAAQVVRGGLICWQLIEGKRLANPG